jgi:hypothetical protein
MLYRTGGQYKADGSITFYLATYEVIKAALGPGFLFKSFTITSSYREPGLPLVQDEIVGVRLKGNDSSNASGSDPSVRKHDLSVMKIKWNGFDPIPNMK